MTCRSRMSAVLAAAAACAGAGASPAAAQDVHSAAGADPAAIQTTVDGFRAALGTLNPNTAGSVQLGRREINWDGVPDQFAAPNALPPDFFNSTSPRGVVFTGADAFQVSADADNPTATPVEFGNLDAGYPDQFRTFSPQRLFTSLGTNVYDVDFFQAGTDVPAVSRGFGAVFTDVDAEDATTLEFFNFFGEPIGAPFAVPTAPGGLSFLGVIFGPDVESPASVRVTQGTVTPGTADGEGADAVAVDDFIYGEPATICHLRAPTMAGTAGPDRLLGTPQADVVVGLGGNDLVLGRDGDDHVCGGDGRDAVSGGRGDDFADGADETGAFLFFERGILADGPDRIRGDAGDDELLGLNGEDRLYGGEGGDGIFGEQDGDRSHGQAGDDFVDPSFGPEDPAPSDDVSLGGPGDDALFDFGGDDGMIAGPGNDVAFGGAGDDRISGGPGDDVLGGVLDEPDFGIFEVEEGDDVIRGGHGDDVLGGGPGEDYLNGEQDTDACVDGEVVRNCEELGAAAALLRERPTSGFAESVRSSSAGARAAAR